MQSSGELSRENGNACLSIVVPANAGTHTAESLCGTRWETIIATTMAWGY